MVVDFLRSCHSSYWRFYDGDRSILTKGYFYFSDKGARSLPYAHYFWSATWTNGDIRSPLSLGPVQDAKRPWFNGQLTIDFPPDIPVGDQTAFDGPLPLPSVLPNDDLREGILPQCWTNPGHPFQGFNGVSALINCCLRKMYARLIQLQYDGDFITITHFFLSWLGTGIIVTNYPAVGNVPAMTIVSSPVYCIVVVSGTSTFQQLALQAFETLVGPSPAGFLNTLPLWFSTSELVTNRLNALGVAATTPIMFAGHSYGAAVVAISAIRLADFTPTRQIKVLTFGMPKPGDLPLNDFLRGIECMHVVNDGDIVPQLPTNLEQASWFPLLISGTLALLWGRWENDQVVRLVFPNGTHNDQQLPTLAQNILLPFVFRAVFGQPLQLISAHPIEEYLQRMFRCKCPRWPIDPDSWAILFPDVIALGAINFGALDVPSPKLVLGWIAASGVSVGDLVLPGVTVPPAPTAAQGYLRLGRETPAEGYMQIGEVTPAAGSLGIGGDAPAVGDLVLPGVTVPPPPPPAEGYVHLDGESPAEGYAHLHGEAPAEGYVQLDGEATAASGLQFEGEVPAGGSLIARGDTPAVGDAVLAGVTPLPPPPLSDEGLVLDGDTIDDFIVVAGGASCAAATPIVLGQWYLYNDTPIGTFWFVITDVLPAAPTNFLFSIIDGAPITDGVWWGINGDCVDFVVAVSQIVSGVYPFTTDPAFPNGILLRYLYAPPSGQPRLFRVDLA